MIRGHHDIDTEIHLLLVCYNTPSTYNMRSFIMFSCSFSQHLKYMTEDDISLPYMTTILLPPLSTTGSDGSQQWTHFQSVLLILDQMCTMHTHLMTLTRRPRLQHAPLPSYMLLSTCIIATLINIQCDTMVNDFIYYKESFSTFIMIFMKLVCPL